MRSDPFMFMIGMILGAFCVLGAAHLLERWRSDWAWEHPLAWWLTAFVGGEFVACGLLVALYLVSSHVA